MIRAALVRVDGKKAAVMSEDRDYGTYRIKYLSDYTGKPISLALPIRFLEERSWIERTSLDNSWKLVLISSVM